MRVLLYLTLIMIIGLIGSAWSVSAMLEYSKNPYDLVINDWHADPDSGSINANPYQKALNAIHGTLPLDTNEAVTFIRDRDDQGKTLKLECNYKISEKIANTRFWTLSLVNPKGQLIEPNWLDSKALYSQNLLYDKAEIFNLNLGQTPAAGNWIPITGKGTFKLILRMYDTPILSSSEIFEIKLPNVTKINCVE